MYSLVSGLIDWYFKTPTLRILIVGEESCGKTVIFVNYIIIYSFFIEIQTFFEKIKEQYLGKKTPLSYIVPTSGLNCKFNKLNKHKEFLVEKTCKQ